MPLGGAQGAPRGRGNRLGSAFWEEPLPQLCAARQPPPQPDVKTATAAPSATSAWLRAECPGSGVGVDCEMCGSSHLTVTSLCGSQYWRGF